MNTTTKNIENIREAARIEKMIARRTEWVLETGGHEQAQHRAVIAELQELLDNLNA